MKPFWSPSRESPVYDSIHGPLPPAPCRANTSGSRRPPADGGTWTRAERSRPELVRVIDALPRRCRPHRVITDLGLAFRVREHALAELLRQHLRAEADAEIRLVLAQRHADPVDLGLDEVVRIVRALRAAEDDGSGMIRHGWRQRVAEPRAADVELVAALAERVTDAPGRRLLLVQDDEDFFGHGVDGSGEAAFNSYRINKQFQCRA